MATDTINQITVRLKLETIPISGIKVHANMRRYEKAELDQGLVASIQERGLLQPLGVYPDGDGYILKYGHRRLKALKHLKWTEVPVIILDPPGKGDDLDQIHENLHRKDPSLAEYVSMVGRFIQEGRARKEIALLLGKPEKWVGEIGRLSNLIPELQERLDEARLDEAARIASYSRERQTEAFKKVKKNFQWWSIRNHLEEHGAVQLERMPWSMDIILDEKGGDGNQLPVCKGCQYRTKNQLGLFHDFSENKGDRCFNPDCYRKKLAAWWEMIGNDHFSHLKQSQTLYTFDPDTHEIPFTRLRKLEEDGDLQKLLKKATHWSGPDGTRWGEPAILVKVGKPDPSAKKGEKPDRFSKVWVSKFTQWMYAFLVPYTWQQFLEAEPLLNGSITLKILQDQMMTQGKLNAVINYEPYYKSRDLFKGMLKPPSDSNRYQLYLADWYDEDPIVLMMNLKKALVKHRIHDAGSSRILIGYLKLMKADWKKEFKRRWSDHPQCLWMREKIYEMATMGELQRMADQVLTGRSITGFKKHALAVTMAREGISIPNMLLDLLDATAVWAGREANLDREASIEYYKDTFPSNEVTA